MHYLIPLLLLVLVSCTNKLNNNTSKISKYDLKGAWYFDEWTSYHTLVFKDSTIFVDNSVDTVFSLNYSLTNDTLITWGEQTNKKYKNKILSLTKDELVLDGIHVNNEKRTYKKTPVLDYK